MKRLLPIVEGDGDMQAVPLLMRCVLNEVLARTDVTVLSAQKRGEWPKVKRDFERVYRSARLETAPTDQGRITARLDLGALRSASESYRRFENAVQFLIQQE
jgi:hypothetical protein